MGEHGPDIENLRLSRKRLLQYGAGAVGAAGLGGFLAACQGDDSAGPPSETEGGETAVATGTPSRGGSIKLAISDAFSTDSLDPVTNFSVFGIMAGGLLYDQLVRLDLDWNIEPMLAEEWNVNADATEWTFKLRKGVEFHSGKELTAEDVAYVYRRNLDESTGGGSYGIFSPFLDPSGITVVDPQTIRFALKAPDAFFIIKTGHFYGHVYEADTDFSSSPGTGPFKSIRFKGGEGFELERNENYWMADRPYLDGVSAIVVPELATKTQAVISGDSHLADPVDWSALQQFEDADNIELLTHPSYAAFVFGVDGTAKPYADPRVRQAMKMLVDRQAFVDVVTRGNAVLSADSAVHPEDPFYPADLQPIPYDPEQATALLADAGYPDGFEETIYTSDCCIGMLDGAQLLQQQWNAGGIKAEVANRTFDELFSKNFLVDRVVTNFWLRQHPSTMMLFMYHSDGIWNESRVKDDQLDQWILEAHASTDPAQQKEIFGEIIRKYSDEQSSIWPFHQYGKFPVKRELQGLSVSPNYLVEYRDAYIAS